LLSVVYYFSGNIDWGLEDRQQVALYCLVDMQQTFFTHSSEETKILAKKLATTMQGGKVLLLFGDLGAGKTTFMQGFAEGLGISQRIISPTFIIMREYELSGSAKC
jgi:predicted ATPase